MTSSEHFLPADLVSEAWKTADELLRNGDSMRRKVVAKQEQLRRSECSLGPGNTAARGSQESTDIDNDENGWETLWRKQQDLWLRSKKLQDMSMDDS